MISSPAKVLDRFSGCSDVSVCDSGQARVLNLERGGITIKVTVPFDVLEWFVDVMDGQTVVVHEWADYEGYDDTPKEELARSMESEVEEFVSKLINRDIRLVARRKTRIEEFVSRLLNRDVRFFAPGRKLEWMVKGSWEQALPVPYPCVSAK